RSSATYVRRTQYFICLLVVTLSRYSYPTRRSSDLAFRLTFHSAGNIAIRTNRQSPRRSRVPRNRRLTAERPNTFNPRQCEISGLHQINGAGSRTTSAHFVNPMWCDLSWRTDVTRSLNRAHEACRFGRFELAKATRSIAFREGLPMTANKSLLILPGDGIGP